MVAIGSVGPWILTGLTSRSVGLYADHVLPRVINALCSTPEIGRWREKVLVGLSGCLVEIGFGSGLNLAHYPSEVEEVLAVEPSFVARRLASERERSSQLRVSYIGLDGQSIPLPASKCDAAVSTFTLCTVPDPGAAIAELFRVLRPGGQLRLLEHGISPDASVASWQRRMEPLHRRLAGGCHLTRDPVKLVSSSGFEIERCEQGYIRGPKPWCWLTLVVAKKL